MKHEGWQSLASLDISLDSEQIGSLERYERLLVDSAVPRGMVASSDLHRLRERHILDSLRAAPMVPPKAESICDLGSGAGLPGVVLAVALPSVEVTLVEVRRARASFLEMVVQELSLENVSVHGRRLEAFRSAVDVCVARAFAPPRKAWEAATRLLRPEGRLIYWAGSSFDPATDAPEGVHVALFPTPALARSGPLAIMTRQ